MTLSPGSLRGRLLLGSLAVGISFAVLFGLGATWRVNQLEDRAVRSALLSRIDVARDEVETNGLLSLDQSSPKTDLVQVVGPDGLVRASSVALAGIAPLVSTRAAYDSPTGAEVRIALQKPDIDLAALGIPIRLQRHGTSPAGTGVLVVAVDSEGFTTATSGLLELLVVGLAAVVAAIALLSWNLTGRALGSVTRLTERAEAAGPGDLIDGLPIPHGDAELARLVGALNRMLHRLETSHAKELQFAADAGHRLRTPVATLRAEAELALRDGDPAEHLAALGRIIKDADQLSLVVDRMLARIRSRHDTHEPIVPILKSAAVRWHRQAELAGVTFQCLISPSLSPSAQCPEAVDVIEPLVDNAIRHTADQGTVTLTVAAEDGTVMAAAIHDNGTGIAPELAATVFDAWVSTRDASLAGGLGLWLARETARDLGGDIRLIASRPGSTTFGIRLPMSGNHPTAER